MPYRCDITDPAVFQVDVLQGLVASKSITQLQRRFFPEEIPGGVQVMQELVVAEASEHSSSA